LRKRDGRRRGQRKRKGHRKLCYEGRCHGVSPWSGGRRAGCPTRRVPLGKLHQRADRKSAACSPSMPPAPPRVREETHRPDELTRAAACSARPGRVGAGARVGGAPVNRKRGRLVPVTAAAARCWRFRAAISHRPGRCLPVRAP
jgi:hypothetical protein